MQADDPISFMQLTAKNEMTSKEDQFQLSLLAAMGNTQRKEAADPLASKLNKVAHKSSAHLHILRLQNSVVDLYIVFLRICIELLQTLHLMGGGSSAIGEGLRSFKVDGSSPG